MAVQISNRKFRGELFINFPYADIYKVDDWDIGEGEDAVYPYIFEWIESPAAEAIIEIDDEAFNFDQMSWASQDNGLVGLRYQVTALGLEPGLYEGSCRILLRDTNEIEHEFGPIPVIIQIEEDVSYHTVEAVAVGRRAFENDVLPPILFTLGWLESEETDFHIQESSLPSTSARFTDPFNGNLLAQQVRRTFYISGENRGGFWRVGNFTDPHKQLVSTSSIPGVAISSPSRGMVWNQNNTSSAEIIVQTAAPNHVYMIDSQSLVSQQSTVSGIEFLRGGQTLDILRLRRPDQLNHFLFCCKGGLVTVFPDIGDLDTANVIDLSSDNNGADFRAAYSIFYDPTASSYGDGTWLADEIDMLISEDGSIFRSIDGATTFSRMGSQPILGSGYGIGAGLIASSFPSSYETPRWIICGGDTSTVNGPGDVGRNMIAYSDDFGENWTEIVAPSLPSGYVSWNGLYDVVVENGSLVGADGHRVLMVGSINTTGGDKHGVIIRTDLTFSSFEVLPQSSVERVDLGAYLKTYIP